MKNKLTKLQKRIISVLEYPISREKICEALGFEIYKQERVREGNTTKHVYQFPSHKKRTTVFDNLDRLRRKKLVKKEKKHNGKRGRPKELWALTEKGKEYA